MHIELMSFGAAVGALLVIVAKLAAQRQRSWVQRDLQRGDLRVLSDFAFFRNRYPPSIVVDRLCERGFVAKTRRGRARMTLNGWVAILAMSMTGTVPVRCVLLYMGSESEYLANARECEGRAQEMPPALRHTFVSLAAHWRKLASNVADAADRRQIQEAADRRKADKG